MYRTYGFRHEIWGFLFFGCCTVLVIAFTCFFALETSGVALEDVDLIFGPDVSFAAKKKSYEELRRASGRSHGHGQGEEWYFLV